MAADENILQDAEKTLKDIERDELNRIIGNGVSFTITRRIRRKKAFPKIGYQVETISEKYEIQEPTLSTLDRLSAIWIDMDIPEQELLKGGADTIRTAKNLANINARRMARIIAVAVLGEDYFIPCQRYGRTAYKGNDKALDDLTEIFLHSLRPSELVSLAQTVTAVSNLGDFIASMRLMSGARTTQPMTGRIE